MVQPIANVAVVRWCCLMQVLVDPADPLATAEFEAERARLDVRFGDPSVPFARTPSSRYPRSHRAR